MKTNHLSRRQFLERSASAAGTLLLTASPWFRAEAATKRTAVDQVALGKTGLKLSRLGFGTGSNGTPTTRASLTSTARKPTAPSSG